MLEFIGMIIDERFEIVEAIGDGAMGTVFTARQIDLDRLVAIKLLHQELLPIMTVDVVLNKKAACFHRFTRNTWLLVTAPVCLARIIPILRWNMFGVLRYVNYSWQKESSAQVAVSLSVSRFVKDYLRLMLPT